MDNENDWWTGEEDSILLSEEILKQLDSDKSESSYDEMDDEVFVDLDENVKNYIRNLAASYKTPSPPARASGGGRSPNPFPASASFTNEWKKMMGSPARRRTNSFSSDDLMNESGSHLITDAQMQQFQASPERAYKRVLSPVVAQSIPILDSSDSSNLFNESGGSILLDNEQMKLFEVTPERAAGRLSPARRLSRSRSPARRLSFNPRPPLNITPVRRVSVSPRPPLNNTPVRRVSVSPRTPLIVSPRPPLNVSPGRRVSVSPGRRLSVSPGRRVSVSPNSSSGSLRIATPERGQPLSTIQSPVRTPVVLTNTPVGENRFLNTVIQSTPVDQLIVLSPPKTPKKMFQVTSPIPFTANEDDIDILDTTAGSILLEDDFLNVVEAMPGRVYNENAYQSDEDLYDEWMDSVGSSILITDEQSQLFDITPERAYQGISTGSSPALDALEDDLNLIGETSNLVLLPDNQTQQIEIRPKRLYRPTIATIPEIVEDMELINESGGSILISNDLMDQLEITPDPSLKHTSPKTALLEVIDDELNWGDDSGGSILLTDAQMTEFEIKPDETPDSVFMLSYVSCCPKSWIDMGLTTNIAFGPNDVYSLYSDLIDLETVINAPLYRNIMDEL